MVIWLKERQLARYCSQRDDKVRKAVKLKKSHEEIETIYQNWEFDVRSTAEEIDALKSKQLLLKANKYDIPHPDRDSRNNYWEQGHYSQKWALSVGGRNLLRSLIRREQRERRERWGWLIPVIFGLIGAITGLASVLRHP